MDDSLRRKLTKLCSLLLWYRSIYLDFCLLHVEKRLWWHVDTNWFIGCLVHCWTRVAEDVLCWGCQLFAKEETLINIFIRSSHAWMWCDEPHKVFCIICLHMFTWDMCVILQFWGWWTVKSPSFKKETAHAIRLNRIFCCNVGTLL